MSRPRPLKCFISSSLESLVDAAELLRALQNLGVDAFVSSGSIGTSEHRHSAIVGTVTAADFVAVVLDGSHSSYQLFELGLAIGLGKPVLLLERQAGNLEEVLAGARIVRVRYDDISSVLPDVRRFLRHVHPKESKSAHLSDEKKAALEAAARAVSARRLESPRKEMYLIQALADLFRAADFETLTDVKTESGTRPDLLVWNDDLVAEFGGPIIVECKYLRGALDAPRRLAESSVMQVDSYLEHSSAAIGLVVFDFDRPTTLQVDSYSTTDIITVVVEDVVQSLTEGTLADDLWRWRARATAKAELGRDAH